MLMSVIRMPHPARVSRRHVPRESSSATRTRGRQLNKDAALGLSAQEKMEKHDVIKAFQAKNHSNSSLPVIWEHTINKVYTLSSACDLLFAEKA